MITLYQMPATSLIPQPEHDPRVGYVTVWLDPDETVRHVWFRRRLMEVMNLPSLPGEEISSLPGRLCGASERFRRPYSRRIRCRASFAMPTGERSREGLFSRSRSTWGFSCRASGRATTAMGSSSGTKSSSSAPPEIGRKTNSPTPFGILEGPLFHLNALNALLTGEYLKEAPFWVDLLSIVLAGSISWGLGFQVRQPKLPVGAHRRRHCLLDWRGCAALSGGIPRHSVLSVARSRLEAAAASSSPEYLLEQKERQRIPENAGGLRLQGSGARGARQSAKLSEHRRRRAPDDDDSFFRYPGLYQSHRGRGRCGQAGPATQRIFHGHGADRFRARGHGG